MRDDLGITEWVTGTVPGSLESRGYGGTRMVIAFTVHHIIIRYNEWKGVKPDCPFIMLSTLDENRDAKLRAMQQG